MRHKAFNALSIQLGFILWTYLVSRHIVTIWLFINEELIVSLLQNSFSPTRGLLQEWSSLVIGSFSLIITLKWGDTPDSKLLSSYYISGLIIVGFSLIQFPTIIQLALLILFYVHYLVGLFMTFQLMYAVLQRNALNTKKQYESKS